MTNILFLEYDSRFTPSQRLSIHCHNVEPLSLSFTTEIVTEILTVAYYKKTKNGVARTKLKLLL